jgi:Fic family protein
VLQGVLTELQKVDRLTQYEYLSAKILMPTLAYARHRGLLTPLEEDVLQMAVKKRVVKSADLGDAMPNLNATQRTYQIKKLVERRMLQPIEANARQYTIGFDNNYLMRGIIHALSQEGFISASLAGTPAAKPTD